MEQLTDEQRKEILKKNGYEELKGYVFEYKREETLNIFITREQVERFHNQEPHNFYWKSPDDYIRSFTEAWEDFVDDYAYDNDLLNSDRAEERLAKELENEDDR